MGVGIFYFLSLLFQSDLHVDIMYLTFALHLSEISFVLIYATLVTVAWLREVVSHVSSSIMSIVLLITNKQAFYNVPR